jgi:hypothetical protein
MKVRNFSFRISLAEEKEQFQTELALFQYRSWSSVVK